MNGHYSAYPEKDRKMNGSCSPATFVDVKLCRICSSPASIPIESPCKPELIRMSRNEFPKWQNLSVQDMIESVSGDMITKEDVLPRFICSHCLYYLQHAYYMKLRIKTNAEDLRIALELAQDSGSINLMTSPIANHTSINQEEILENDLECEHEAYVYSTFKDLDIQFSLDQPGERIIERECQTCKKRYLEVEPYDSHVKVTGQYFSENNSN